MEGGYRQWPRAKLCGTAAFKKVGRPLRVALCLLHDRVRLRRPPRLVVGRYAARSGQSKASSRSLTIGATEFLSTVKDERQARRTATH